MSYSIKTDVLLKNICRCSTFLQFQRYRGKINIQRPRKPHYDRALMEAATAPQYPEPVKKLTCFEKLYKRNKIENPYNDIIAREVRNWLNHSQMITIFHLNSLKADDMFEVRVALHKQGMNLKTYGKEILTKALKGTRYETLLSLCNTKYCLVFAPHQNVNALIKITRKIPQMILLAGVVDNTLLSRKELMAYAALPGLQSGQAQFVNTLNIAANNLVQNLQAHQNNLIKILDVYAKKDENVNATATSNKDKDDSGEDEKT